MTAALLDILLANQNQAPGDHEAILYASVHSHLTRLLNTRRGSLQHMPDYGLPDMTEIYQSLPYSVHQLVRAIHETISKYESRLSQIKVHYLPDQSQDGVIHIAVEGRVSQGQKISFATYFVSGDSVKVLAKEKL